MSTENPTPRVGDIGTKVRIEMGEDLSGATTLKVKYLKSDLVSVGEVVGASYGVGDTQIEATLPVLDMEGDWVLVPYTEGLISWTGHGDPIYMHVYGIYEVVGD